MRRALLWLSPLTLGWLLAACPHRGPSPPGSRFETAPALIEAMIEKGRKIGAIRASGTVEMRQGNKRIKARVLYLARRPAELRFETESFFDQPMSILVFDGRELVAWDLNEGRILRGPASPANISRLIPVPMEAGVVVGLLMGEPPLIRFQRALLDRQGDRYRLQLEGEGQTERLLVDPGSLRPLEVHCELDGKPTFHLHYQDWGEHAPRRVQFEMPAEGLKLKIRIREIEIDPKLDDALFHLEPPEGAEVEELD
ncbi:MAG: DUF4292 domain-containing protein [Deltaproteobacteria bacterium]|nr:DUF4292 domain-containing protein [Deltaproteobacteria bacterium]